MWESARTFGEKGLRNISGIFPLSVTQPTPQVIIPVWITTSLWIGLSLNTTRTIKEAMYIRVSNPSFNRNIGKFQLPTYGMRSCSTPLTSNSNRSFHISGYSLCMTNNPFWLCRGAYNLCLQLTIFGRYVVYISNLVPCHLAPGAIHHTSSGAICDKYKYWYI